MALSRPRLVVLRALGLGDFLTGVPAMRALRSALDDHEVVLAAPAPLAPLVGLAGVADRLVDTRGLAPVRLPGARPAVAVNLHGRGPQSHRLLLDLEPDRLVAFGCEEVGHRGPAWHEQEHEVARWCRLLAEALAVPADAGDRRLATPGTPSPRPGATVVHPGAAYPARRWPAQRFAEVARRLAAGGHDVVLTGAAGELDRCEEVRRSADLPPGAVLAGHTDLAALAALVAHARLVVCGDTGVAHLASAYGTPSVLLFGPTAPARWGPPESGPHTVLWHGDGRGDPWGSEPDPALLRITVEEVLDAVGLTGRRTTPGSA